MQTVTKIFLTKENIDIKPQRNNREKRKNDIRSPSNSGKTFPMCVKAHLSQFGLLK